MWVWRAWGAVRDWTAIILTEGFVVISCGGYKNIIRGFTLVESMVVIAIFAILAAIAALSMVTTTANRHMQSAAFELLSSILQARSFATTQGRPTEMWPAYTTGFASNSSVWNVQMSKRGSSIFCLNSQMVNPSKSYLLLDQTVTPSTASGTDTNRFVRQVYSTSVAFRSALGG